MAQPSFGLEIDVDRYLRDLDAVGRIALPAAARETLNKAAFDAQGALTRHAADVFDRPKTFTTRAFVVERAKRGATLDGMSSAVRAKDAQAAYLRLQIEGGKRTASDPGVRGKDDVFTKAARTDKYGNIPRNFIRALTAERRAEAAKRAVFAANKEELTERWGAEDDAAFDAAMEGYDATAFGMNRKERGRKPKFKARRRVTYDSVHAPGIFFGEIDGVKGYWRRPKRSAPSGRRQRGVKQVKDAGPPTLLLRVQDDASYKPLFRYNEVIAESYRHFGAPAEFARELDRQIARLHEKGQRPRQPAREPGFRRPSFLGGE